jgi:uncharacterized protein YndB with AHSA1/START domain
MCLKHEQYLEGVSGVRVEQQIDIARPIDDVFAYISTPEHNERWMNQILSTERVSDEPMQVGATWRHTVRTLGRTYDVVFEVTEFDPPFRCSVRNIQGPFTFHGHYTLEPTSTGTRLTFVIEGDAAGFFRLADPLAERAIARQFAADFATLKDMLEHQPELATVSG